MSGTLYLVGTPIGNLGDITLRAIETLEMVDMIACEDTRHSGVLLNKFNIKKPTMRCDAHKENYAAETIVELLKTGKNVALITDAGMPCVSDPGAIVVATVRENGFNVTVVPGASAVVSAMALTGISRRGFCFLGFLPEKNKDRLELVEPYRTIDIQLVFYASPHDINEDLDFLYTVLGDRKVYVVKEITKIYERVEQGELSSFRVVEPRGEFVVIIEGKKQSLERCELSIEEHLRQLMDSGVGKKDAIKQTAKERGLTKDDVYKMAISLDL